MGVRVINVSDHMVLVRLRSGGALHLASGEQSEELPEQELVGNPRVTPLCASGVITLEQTKSGSQKKPTAAKSSAPSAQTMTE